MAAVAVLLVAGCDTAPPSRGGSPAQPIALRSVYGNGPGSVGGDVLAAMISAGPGADVTITDLWATLHTVDETDSDGAAIEDLRTGRADLAVVRAGRLAQAGASSLSALQAPGVVTNDDQAMKVALAPVADSAMADLPEIGLVGLVIAPGGLRHPFGYRSPLVTPDAFAGMSVNTRPDLVATQILEALGARPDSSVGEARSLAAQSGVLRGIETSLGQQSAVERPAVVTSNVALYEKFDVLVVRKELWDGLSAAQQSVLRQLAEQARAHALSERPDEETALAAWCSQEATGSVVATDAQLRAFADALAPVAEAIRQEVGTDLVDDIVALHEGTTDLRGSTCEVSEAATSSAPATELLPTLTMLPVGDQSVLDGIWRFEVAAEELRDRGADAQFAADNAGVWTFTVEKGTVTIETSVNGAKLPTCTGRFILDESRVVFDWAVDGNTNCNSVDAGTYSADGRTVTFDWSLDAQGQQALTNQQALLPAMQKIG